MVVKTRKSENVTKTKDIESLPGAVIPKVAPSYEEAAWSLKKPLETVPARYREPVAVQQQFLIVDLTEPAKEFANHAFSLSLLAPWG